MIELGSLEAIFRYPVKSMAGESLQSAEMGWHGIEGDRRLALRRVEDRGEFPFLTAGKLPALVRFTPILCEDSSTRIRTPEGMEMDAFAPELAEDVGRRIGAPVQMMRFRNGIFDDAAISVIATCTVGEIARLAGVPDDVRRFRPNILVRSLRSEPFQEDEWIGGTLIFGEEEDAPAIAVTQPDVRCGMLNLDPDTAIPNPEVMKAAVRANENCAGVYATVTRAGRLRVGARVFFRDASR